MMASISMECVLHGFCFDPSLVSFFFLFDGDRTRTGQVMSPHSLPTNSLCSEMSGGVTVRHTLTYISLAARLLALLSSRPKRAVARRGFSLNACNLSHSITYLRLIYSTRPMLFDHTSDAYKEDKTPHLASLSQQTPFFLFFSFRPHFCIHIGFLSFLHRFTFIHLRIHFSHSFPAFI